MRRRTNLLCIIAGLGLAVAAGAQQSIDSDGDNPDEVRRYTVEMIIFSYTEDVSVGSEVFVADVVIPDLDNDPDTGLESALDAEPPVEPGPGEDESPPAVEFELKTLARSEFTMNETWGHLRRLDAYRPLMHFGWTQTMLPEENTPQLPLARFGQPPAGLDGELKLYLSRFLHLVVDVSLPAPAGAGSALSATPRVDAAANGFGDERAQNRSNRDTIAYEYEALRYRITENRIMKNGETRYYDHPKLGVIAKVTRVEEDAGNSAGF